MPPDAVIVPGGFSYGDYLRCGAIARFSPVMEAVQQFAADGGLVLGICNGFQVLCEAETSKNELVFVIPAGLKKSAADLSSRLVTAWPSAAKRHASSAGTPAATATSSNVNHAGGDARGGERSSMYRSMDVSAGDWPGDRAGRGQTRVRPSFDRGQTSARPRSDPGLTPV